MPLPVPGWPGPDGEPDAERWRRAVATEPPAAPVAQVDPGGAAAVPGGVGGGDLPAIFRAADLSPVVLLVSLLTAAALGAGHALTPGHGKTLMAAYLVGTRGTPLHAAGLGLSVTLSHTLGILVLAALIVGAEGVLSPDTVVRGAPIVAAISILAIGGWMLFGEARRRWRAGAADRAHRAAHAHGDGPRPRDARRPRQRRMPRARRRATTAHAADDPVGTHSHGGVAHSHLPPSGTTITWRGLFVLGLAGGLIPSTSALLILLGSIAAGRPAFGFVLVVAFGLGMALVMGGIGLALVLARGRLDRFDAGSPLGRASGFVPLAAACLVLASGPVPHRPGGRRRDDVLTGRRAAAAPRRSIGNPTDCPVQTPLLRSAAHARPDRPRPRYGCCPGRRLCRRSGRPSPRGEHLDQDRPRRGRGVR